MQLFYTPTLKPNLQSFILSEEESKHAVQVLRMGVGATLHLLDGVGGLYTAEIIEIKAKKCVLAIQNYEFFEKERPYSLHIAIAPTKNIERIEWFLEKATEYGIDTITPIICSRSERKDVKTERLTKVITSAVKQSLKYWHPIINEPITFKAFIEKEIEGAKYIAHCLPAERQKLAPHQNYTILIGPEGDFTEDEIVSATKAGYVPLSIGSQRFRTETAALVACMEVGFRNG